VIINGGYDQEEREAEVETIVATQSEEFCSLNDSHSAIDCASLRRFEWPDEVGQAWLQVERILTYFLLVECLIALTAAKIPCTIAMK
jgi:hypothetical protein